LAGVLSEIGLGMLLHWNGISRLYKEIDVNEPFGAVDQEEVTL